MLYFFITRLLKNHYLKYCFWKKIATKQEKEYRSICNFWLYFGDYWFLKNKYMGSLDFFEFTQSSLFYFFAFHFSIWKICIISFCLCIYTHTHIYAHIISRSSRFLCIIRDISAWDDAYIFTCSRRWSGEWEIEV